MNNLQLISATLQYGLADTVLFKEIVRAKYIAVFESIFPILMKEDDKNLFNACLDFYNSCRIEQMKVNNLKEQLEIENATKEVKGFNQVKL